VTYREAVAWLYGQQLHGIQPGLERMQRLGAELDLQTDLSGSRKAPRRAVHVAGTNGKGSVCAMVDAMCRADGLRTGLYTSPHLVSFRERIRVDGAMIGETEVAEGITLIRDLIAKWEQPATFFEIVTALALWHFQRCECEIVVLETGLGGRLDATNVVTPAVAIITPIGLDHQQWLGDTVEKIAMEKAGIIKPFVPTILARQTPAVKELLCRTAHDIGSIAHPVDAPLEGYPINLPGEHQRWNAAVALSVGDELSLSWEAIEEGLRTVEWPGRFQRVGEQIVLDGAHNPAAAAALVDAWREVFGERKATLILGVMSDKDVAGVCAALAPIAARTCTVHVDNPRSCKAGTLADIAAKTMPAVPARSMPSLAAALAEAKTHADPVLIAGSLFLVGEALVALGLAEGEGERSAQ